MSGFKSSENDLMKNLSALEKRKLMRHIENAEQGSQRKSTVQPARNYNVTPKPFSTSGSTHQSSKHGSIISSKPSAAKQFGASLNPVQASNGKSDVVVPKLNQDFVNMFNAQAGSSQKPKLKTVSNKVTSSENSIKNKPFHVKTPPVVNQSSKVTSTNFAKISPVPSAAHRPSGYAPSYSRPSSSPIVTPARKIISTDNKLGDNNASNAKKVSQPTAVQKPVVVSQNVVDKSAQSSVNHARAVFEEKKRPVVAEVQSKSKAQPRPKDPPKMVQSANKSSQDVKPSLKQAPTIAAVASKPTSHALPPRAEPLTQNKNSGKRAPTVAAVASKPTSHALPPRAEPLTQDKNSGKSPPTAVVSPVQDKSKNPLNELKSSAEAARQRSVSTPVHPPSNVVAYSAAADHVNLPDLSIAERNSVLASETRMKRSFSDVSKVVQRKDAAHKNKKLGHNFEPYELKDWVNWCDACGSVILSLFGKCVSCTKCKMVCHGKCALSVSITCEADQQLRSHTLTDSALSFYKTIVQETKDESTLKEFNTIQRVITIEEVQQRIEEFNKTVKGTQQMTLQENGETFRGFIRVTINLTRPVSVIDNTSKTVKKPVQKKASFYIDKGAVKALHLTSDTTAEQVVQALLHKYNITDNPMKFALFEKQVREEGHVILRKMLPRERPLFLRLLWGNGNNDKRGFTLQENETRDIHWESFSIAELQMFIKILDKEENDYIIDIKRKYKNKATDIRNAIEHQNKMLAVGS